VPEGVHTEKNGFAGVAGRTKHMGSADTEIADRTEKNGFAHTEVADRTEKNGFAHTGVADRTEKNGFAEVADRMKHMGFAHTGVADRTEKNGFAHTGVADRTEKNDFAHTEVADRTEKNGSADIEVATILVQEVVVAPKHPAKGRKTLLRLRYLDVFLLPPLADFPFSFALTRYTIASRTDFPAFFVSTGFSTFTVLVWFRGWRHWRIFHPPPALRFNQSSKLRS
jgi:hypothetical protein